MQIRVLVGATDDVDDGVEVRLCADNFMLENDWDGWVAQVEAEKRKVAYLTRWAEVELEVDEDAVLGRLFPERSRIGARIVS